MPTAAAVQQSTCTLSLQRSPSGDPAVLGRPAHRNSHHGIRVHSLGRAPEDASARLASRPSLPSPSHRRNSITASRSEAVEGRDGRRHSHLRATLRQNLPQLPKVRRPVTVERSGAPTGESLKGK